jgi:hypothetical protein
MLIITYLEVKTKCDFIDIFVSDLKLKKNE